MNKEELIKKYGKTQFDNLFSEEIWRDNYKDINDNDITDTIYRIASTMASKEKNKDYWTEQFFQLLSDFKMTPGGRIISNAGTQWQGTTMFNCYVGTKPDFDQDSIDGIYATLIAQAKTLKSEGGWGMNFSFIRPRGSFIKGIGAESPGAVKFMELFDKSSEIITMGAGKKKKTKQGKEKIRKGAQMGSLDCWHPDIEEFVTAKLTPGRLTKFNISVNCVNDFMDKIITVEKLKADGANQEEIDIADKWDLAFPDTENSNFKAEWDGNLALWKEKGYPIIVYKTVSATELFDMIVNSTYTRNDPGVQFMYLANKTHLWNYGGSKSIIKATNPCGEQNLIFGGICLLGSLNLTKFINPDFNGNNDAFDYKTIASQIRVMTRFLDNVNDVSDAPLPEYIENARNLRRIGQGILGWGSALFMLKVKFGSQEAEKIKEQLMQTIAYNSIDASADLAIEKGPFVGCDFEKSSDHYFFKLIDLPNTIKEKIRKHGLRNSALFSIQPTGNTGIFCGIVSGGLEPLFMPQYIRTMILPSCPNELLDKVPKYWEEQFHENEYFKLSKEGTDEILIANIDDIVYKIDKNRGLTREILCEDYSVKYLKEKGLWEPNADWAVTTVDLSVDEHLTDMKGWCKWLDSSASKTINIPSDYSYGDFKNVYLDAYKSGVIKGITTYRAGTMNTVLKAVDESNNHKTITKEINYTQAPKRPDLLPCSIYHPTIEGNKWTIVIGELEGKPYEIFAGLSEYVELPKKHKSGFIKKRKCEKISNEDRKSCYDLLIGEEEDPMIVKDIAKAFRDDDSSWATRMLSTSLRHGVPVHFIVEQLSRDSGSNFHSFSKVIARTLKKYVVDGSKSGESCPDCDNKMVFQEGCHLCPNCGYSKCA